MKLNIVKTDYFVKSLAELGQAPYDALKLHPHPVKWCSLQFHL
jgi:hypothetical protein